MRFFKKKEKIQYCGQTRKHFKSLQNEIDKRQGVKKRHSVPKTKKTVKTKTTKSKIKSSKPGFLVSPRLTVPKIGPKLKPKLNK